MPVTGIARLERFFRLTASLDVDKSDLKRYQAFMNQKVYDLFLIAQGTAKANGRDVIAPRDIPITKGLQESIHAFREVDAQLELAPLLDNLVALPPLDFALAEETSARLPDIVGGLSLALGRTFKILDADLKNPHTEAWERAFKVFGLLL
jgi:hypothetical protein